MDKTGNKIQTVAETIFILSIVLDVLLGIVILVLLNRTLNSSGLICLIIVVIIVALKIVFDYIFYLLLNGYGIIVQDCEELKQLAKGDREDVVTENIEEQ